MARGDKKMDLLYVDSTAAGVKEFKELIGHWPLHLRLASTAAEAGHLITDVPPDMVISELRLSDMNGLSFLIAVQSFFEIPGVLFSAATPVSEEPVDIPVLFRPCSREALHRVVFSAKPVLHRD